MAADLWEVVQGRETRLQKPVKPDIASFLRSTRANSAAAEESQTVAESQSQSASQQAPIGLTNLTAGNQTLYVTAMNLYENELKAYNSQRRELQQLIDYIRRTVSPAYRKICCNPDLPISTWYTNLKKSAGTSTLQEKENARSRYNKAIRPLKIKDYEKWITEWELAIHHAQNKGIGATLSPSDWMEDLFSAVSQALPEWVISYCLISRDKIEDGTLEFRDTAKALREAAAHQARAKPSRYGKGSFGPSFAGEEAESLQGDALDAADNEGEPAARKRRRRKSTKGAANEQPADSAPPNQDAQSGPPAKRPQKCRGCGGPHFYRKCFYLFPSCAPEYWVPRAEISKTVKKALDEDADFAEEIRKLQLVQNEKQNKNKD